MPRLHRPTKRRYPGEQTPLEQASKIRNWKIRSLRGAYSQLSGLITDKGALDTALRIIDDELFLLGAETEDARRFRRIQEELEQEANQ